MVQMLKKILFLICLEMEICQRTFNLHIFIKKETRKRPQKVMKNLKLEGSEFSRVLLLLCMAFREISENKTTIGNKASKSQDQDLSFGLMTRLFKIAPNSII